MKKMENKMNCMFCGSVIAEPGKVKFEPNGEVKAICNSCLKHAEEFVKGRPFKPNGK